MELWYISDQQKAIQLIHLSRLQTIYNSNRKEETHRTTASLQMKVVSTAAPGLHATRSASEPSHTQRPFGIFRDVLQSRAAAHR